MDFTLQGEFDVYQEYGDAQGQVLPFYLRRRCRVTEVMVECGVMLALTDSGACAAFVLGVCLGPGRERHLLKSFPANGVPMPAALGTPFLRQSAPLSRLWRAVGAGTSQRPCYLNIDSEDIVRSIFFNRVRQELILASIQPGDNYQALR